MARVAKGSMAASTLEAIRIADALQGLAVATISEEFSAEDEDEALAFEQFVKELEAATTNGTREAFDESLRQMLLPIIQQAMQEGQGQ